MKTLYIIDGSYYIYRAYYAIRGLSNSEGFPTNGLFGFSQMVDKLIADTKPTHLVVTFDPGGKGWRHEIYPDYKATRQKLPEDLEPQMPCFRDMMRAYRIPIFEVERQEADDVIGTLTVQAVDAGFKVVILTGDKDLTQLVNEHVTLWDNMRDRHMGAEEVREKFKVEPSQMIDLLGLMGDSSDNIPGVPGVGEKTAIKLISQYGSMEGVYEHADTIKGKLGERVRANKEQALLSRRLATINCDLPVRFDADKAELEGPDAPKLLALFRTWEFDRKVAALERKYDIKAATVALVEAPPEKRYEVVTTEKALKQVVTKLRKAKRLGIDLESDGSRPMQAQITGISLAWTPHRAVHIPIARGSAGTGLAIDVVLERLRGVLEDPTVLVSGAKTKSDWLVLRQAGVDMRGIECDTALASYVLDPAEPKHDLRRLAVAELRYELQRGTGAASGPKQGSLNFDDTPPVDHFAPESADVSLLLRDVLLPQLDDADLRELYSGLELPASRVLGRMERSGVFVDPDVLRALGREFESRAEAISREIFEAAGREFTINSPKQLREILFDELGLPVVKRTKTGASTDASVLEELREEHALPGLILDYRRLAKLKSTYTDALVKLIHPVTGRIHTEFRQDVAATGRLSSNNPNLQNIPIRTAEGRRIRTAFVAPPGRVLLSADYSQVELRILAHMSKSQVLVDAFLQDQDIHARTAAEVFQLDPAEITTGQRAMAKTINFGVLYGMGPVRLSRELGLSRQEAREFIDRYFERIAGVRDFLDGLVTQARDQGYARTLLGRRRSIPELKSRNRGKQALGERLAINTPIQGTAADIIKKAMCNVQDALDATDIEATMLLQVHDELVFEVEEDAVDRLTELVVQEMAGAVTLDVPLKVDVGSGVDWASVK